MHDLVKLWLHYATKKKVSFEWIFLAKTFVVTHKNFSAGWLGWKDSSSLLKLRLKNQIWAISGVLSLCFRVGAVGFIGVFWPLLYGVSCEKKKPKIRNIEKIICTSKSMGQFLSRRKCFFEQYFSGTWIFRITYGLSLIHISEPTRPY